MEHSRLGHSGKVSNIKQLDPFAKFFRDAEIEIES